MIHARRKDANHAAIKAHLERLGCYVLDLYQLAGRLDMLVGHRGRWVLLEVKDGAKVPSARKVTPAEQIILDAAARVQAPTFVVVSEEEAEQAVVYREDSVEGTVY